MYLTNFKQKIPEGAFNSPNSELSDGPLSLKSFNSQFQCLYVAAVCPASCSPARDQLAAD